MVWLVVLIVLLVAFGSLLAVAETATSRMTLVRAIALKEAGRRNGGLLEVIESDPPGYLNPIYLVVTCVQNGAAILAAAAAEQYFGDLGITLVLAGFTLVYFVAVEAMAKTWGIQHSDSAALALAPLVWLLGRIFAVPTRLLITVANVLLPGKGLAQGPFVSEEDIRSMAEVGHQEGSIEESERRMIHSVFEFSDTVVREIMVPRPDIVAVQADDPLRVALEKIVGEGFSRLPVYRGDLDKVEGVLYAKDALEALYRGAHDIGVAEIMRPAHFVPQTNRATNLLREMQREKFHLAIVVDEYGSTAGLLTLENLLEQLVGDIADEHEHGEEREVETLGDGRYRVDAAVPIEELEELPRLAAARALEHGRRPHVRSARHDPDGGRAGRARRPALHRGEGAGASRDDGARREDHGVVARPLASRVPRAFRHAHGCRAPPSRTGCKFRSTN
jgi:CBS domain containing-hemolysin-like protein